MIKKDRIEELEQRLDSAERKIKYLAEVIDQMNSQLGTKIDEHITGKVYYQVVERIEDYEKGMKMEPVIKQIKEILK